MGFLGGDDTAFFQRMFWTHVLDAVAYGAVSDLARGANSVAAGTQAQTQAQAQADLQFALAQQLQALDRLVQSLVSCEVGFDIFHVAR